MKASGISSCGYYKDHDERGTETAEHVRLDNLAQETFNRLRGYLYDETIVAEVIRPESGMREPVPAFYWGSEDADKVVYEGYIRMAIIMRFIFGKSMCSKKKIYHPHIRF